MLLRVGFFGNYFSFYRPSLKWKTCPSFYCTSHQSYLICIQSGYKSIPFTMKLSTSFGTLAVLVPAALAASLPKCSSTSTTPCTCPSGTQYEQSVTFAVIGAAAKDVKALTSDCLSTKQYLIHMERTLTHTIVVYKIAWLGVEPFATKGPNNTPGVSLRSVHLPTLVGTYNITERVRIP